MWPPLLQGRRGRKNPAPRSTPFRSAKFSRCPPLVCLITDSFQHGPNVAGMRAIIFIVAAAAVLLGWTLLRAPSPTRTAPPVAEATVPTVADDPSPRAISSTSATPVVQEQKPPPTNFMALLIK